MFYLIIAILIGLYYFFMAPKTVKNTLNIIGVVGLIALFIVLAGMSFVEIIHLPIEVFLGIGMIIIGYRAFRDVMALSAVPVVKSNSKRQRL